jgi:hypothetical protein
MEEGEVHSRSPSRHSSPPYSTDSPYNPLGYEDVPVEPLPPRGRKQGQTQGRITKRTRVEAPTVDDFLEYKEELVKSIKKRGYIVPPQKKEGIKSSFPLTCARVPLPDTTPLTSADVSDLLKEKAALKKSLDDFRIRILIETFIGTPVLKYDAAENKYVEVRNKDGNIVRWNKDALRCLLNGTSSEYVNHFIQNHALIWDMGPEMDIVRLMLENQSTSTITASEFSKNSIQEKIAAINTKYNAIMNTLRTAPRLTEDVDNMSSKIYRKALGLTGVGNLASCAQNIVNYLREMIGLVPQSELENSVANILFLNIAIVSLIALYPGRAPFLVKELQALQDFCLAFLTTGFSLLYGKDISFFIGEFFDIVVKRAQNITHIVTRVSGQIVEYFNVVRENIHELSLMIKSPDTEEVKDQKVTAAAKELLSSIVEKDKLYGFDPERETAMGLFKFSSKKAIDMDKETTENLPDWLLPPGGKHGGKRGTRRAKKSTRKTRRQK